jgi:hypothetical protein
MKTIKTIDRWVTAPLLYILMSQLLCFSYQAWGIVMGTLEEGQEVVIPTICYFFAVAVALWAFYSLCRLETIYHEEAMLRYAETPSQNALGRLVCLAKEKDFWIPLGLIALLYAALPMKWTFAAFHGWLMGGEETLASKWQAMLLLLPLVVAVSFLGRLAGAKQWHRLKFELTPFREKVRNRAISRWMVAYLLGGAVLLNFVIPFLASYILGFLSILSSYAITWVVILLVGFYAFRWLRVFLARRRLLKRLLKLTRMDIKDVKNPYRSLLYFKEGEADFTVESKGKTYSCKLLCAHKPLAPLYIESEGTYRFVHRIRLAQLEFFRYETEGNFTFEAEGEKVLIVNPVPRKVFGRHLEKEWLLDNGDKVGSYRVFTAGAFLNALERDCLDRIG